MKLFLICKLSKITFLKCWLCICFIRLNSKDDETQRSKISLRLYLIWKFVEKLFECSKEKNDNSNIFNIYFFKDMQERL